MVEDLKKNVNKNGEKMFSSDLIHWNMQTRWYFLRLSDLLKSICIYSNTSHKHSKYFNLLTDMFVHCLNEIRFI